MLHFNNDRSELKCSFCGKSEHIVRKLIAGKGVYICDSCVDLCNEILQRDVDDDLSDSDYLPKPKDICAKLNEYIIGQDDAKKALSVAVYNHFKRANYHPKGDDVIIQKSNILMIGPTGCGKTLLAQTLANILNVPFAIVDANSLTEAGYVGQDVDDILLALIQAADGDILKAERGIVYIDEVDKIARKPGMYRDISGEGVQQALLKILEGTRVTVQIPSKQSQPANVSIDTKNILFICGGAFNDLNHIIDNRINSNKLGFGANINSKADYTNYFNDVQPDDLIQAGLIPEFIGRLPIIVSLHPLNQSDLVDILTKPKNALVKQFQKLFELDGSKLTFEPDALQLIAKEAIARNTGARGLRSILEGLMENLMYEVATNTECKVTKEDVEVGKKDG